MSSLFGNRLLDSVEREELKRFQRHLTRTCLVPGEMLDTRELTSPYLYFPQTGVVSLLSATAHGHSVEVALTSRDGMIGAFEAIGQAQPPLTARVQVEGDAWRLPLAVFREQLGNCGGLLSAVHGYLQCLMVQVAQSAVCNRFHTSEQRLARWLLTTAAAAERDTFTLTHDEIAQMIGSPRSAVTGAAAALRRAGFIDYTRGRLTILDRSGLQGIACECFEVVREALEIGCASTPPGRVA